MTNEELSAVDTVLTPHASSSSTLANASPGNLSSHYNTPILSNTARDRAHHRSTPFGNYHQYYSHRKQAIPDDRLSLLAKVRNSDGNSFFKGKKVLDLGCNAGKLTIECVRYLEAREAFGIDIDALLIENAKSELARQIMSGTAGEEFQIGANQKIQFEVHDFMSDEYDFQPEEYDTILLLSITKWLHLNHGDAALCRLFSRLHSALKSGGLLVVEPQERENYKSAVRKNKNLKEMYKTLQIWPPFEIEINEAGFVLLETIQRQEVSRQKRSVPLATSFSDKS